MRQTIWILIFAGIIINAQKNDGSFDKKSSQEKGDSGTSISSKNNFNAETKVRRPTNNIPFLPQNAEFSRPLNFPHIQLLPGEVEALENNGNIVNAPTRSQKTGSHKFEKEISSHTSQLHSHMIANSGEDDLASEVVTSRNIQAPPTVNKSGRQKSSKHSKENSMGNPNLPLLQVDPPQAPGLAPFDKTKGSSISIDNHHFPSVPKIADLDHNGHTSQVEEINVEDQLPEIPSKMKTQIPQESVGGLNPHPEDHGMFDSEKFANLVNDKFSYIIKNLTESGYLSEKDQIDENLLKNISNSFAEFVEKTLKLHTTTNLMNDNKADQEQILDMGADQVIADFKNKLAIPIFGPPGHTDVVERRQGHSEDNIDVENGQKKPVIDRVAKIPKTHNVPVVKLAQEKPISSVALGTGVERKVFNPNKKVEVTDQEPGINESTENKEGSGETVAPIRRPLKSQQGLFPTDEQAGPGLLVPPLEKGDNNRSPKIGIVREPPKRPFNPKVPVEQETESFGQNPQEPSEIGNGTIVPGQSEENIASKSISPQENSTPIEQEQSQNISSKEFPLKGKIVPEFAAEERVSEIVTETTPLILIRIPVENVTVQVVQDTPKVLFGQSNGSATEIWGSTSKLETTTTDIPDLLSFIDGKFANVPTLRMPANVDSSTQSTLIFSSNVSQSSQAQSGEFTATIEVGNTSTNDSTFPTPPSWGTFVKNFSDEEATSTISSLDNSTVTTATESIQSNQSNETSSFLNTTQTMHPAFILGETEETESESSTQTSASFSSSTFENVTVSTSEFGNTSFSFGVTLAENGSESSTSNETISSNSTEAFSILTSESGIGTQTQTIQPETNVSMIAIGPGFQTQSIMIGTDSSTQPSTDVINTSMVITTNSEMGSTTDFSMNLTTVSIPENITNATVTATTEKSEESVSWNLRLTSIDWDSGLNDKDSWQYKNLFEAIYPDLEKTFQGILKDNYVKTTIKRFSPGSVIVSGKTESRTKIDYQQFTDEFEKSLKAMSYKLSHYAVDPNSVNVDNPGSSAPQRIDATTKTGGGLPGYAIAIIVVAIAVLAVLLAAGFYVRRYRTRRLREDNYMVDEETMNGLAGRAVKNWQQQPPLNGAGGGAPPPRPQRIHNGAHNNGAGAARAPRAEMSASMNIYEMKDQQPALPAVTGQAVAHVNQAYQGDTRSNGRSFQDVELQVPRNEESSKH